LRGAGAGAEHPVEDDRPGEGSGPMPASAGTPASGVSRSPFAVVDPAVAASVARSTAASLAAAEPWAAAFGSPARPEPDAAVSAEPGFREPDPLSAHTPDPL